MSSNDEQSHLLTNNERTAEADQRNEDRTSAQDIDLNKKKSPPSQQQNQTNKHLKSDNRQMNKFISPMFGDLERIVAEQMKQLDKLEDKSMDAIMRNLEELIINTTESVTKSIDPSQKKAHDALQAKFSKPNESITTSNSNMNEDKSQSAENSDEQDEKIDFKSLNLSNLACISQSLSAYLVTRNSRRTGDKLKNITIKIYDAVNLWLSHLFRFDNSSVLFHEQEPDGFVRMCQIMLNCKYSEYQLNGYQSINRQPAIYISAASKYSLPEYRELISIQLGLPLSSIRVVTTSKVVDPNLDKIDIEAFNKQLESDLADGFVPMVLLANAGSYEIGQCDDLSQLNLIAYKYRIWIHLEGVYLSSLALYSVPTEIQHVASGDSISIPLGEWLGLPNLSYVTLYKNVKNSNLYLQPFNSVLSTLQRCLPYWCVLQAIGHQGVIEKIKNATDKTYYMNEIVKKHRPYLKILDYKTPAQETHLKINSLGDLFNKCLNLLTFVELKNPIVVFKCDKAYIKERLYLFSDLNKTHKEKNTKRESLKSENLKEEFVKMLQEPEPDLMYSRTLKKSDDTLNSENSSDNNIDDNNSEIREYTDTLTTWLCDLMNSLHRNIEFELIEIENEGICIRYSPLEHANILGTSEGDIKTFDKSLEDIITILDASIKCKSIFAKEINEFKNLIPVSIPKWAGIGAVRYIPDYLIDKLDDISKYLELIKEKEFSSSITESTDSAVETDNDASKCESEHDSHRVSKLDETLDEKIKQQFQQDIREINEINEQLVKTLQAQDGAFSIGQAYDGMKAVKFGMVNDLEVLKKLASQVQEVGQTVEEESRYIEKMAELIRIGIEKANEDLKKENEAKMQQQGILRQIPIINDVLKWWGPSDASITGRTFNLQSGKIASTEVTYKYHIQVEEDENQIANSKKKKSLDEKEINSELTSTNHNDNSETNLDSK